MPIYSEKINLLPSFNISVTSRSSRQKYFSIPEGISCKRFICKLGLLSFHPPSHHYGSPTPTSPYL